MSVLVTGRSSFPLKALTYCQPHDPGDIAVIVRSIFLGSRFHGLVELEASTTEAVQLLRRAGWKVYNPPPKGASS